MSYTPHYIASFENNAGLNTYYEPFLIPEKAFATLEDAYCWRGRVKRRQGFSNLGRLRRTLTLAAMGNISAAGAGTFTFNIFTGLGLLATEPNAEIANENISIVIGAPINQTLTYTAATSTWAIAPAGLITAVSLNFATGVLTLTFSGAAGASAATFTGSYFPCLPVMALPTNQQDAINAENLFAFDTKYAYRFNPAILLFEELVPGTTWRGTDSDFFWTLTYWPQTASSSKFLWATNFNNNGITPDPLRYFNGANWINFTPLVTATDTLWTCECIIPYKNRLLFLNTWEGPTAGGQGAATNYPQRLRFSQIGDPTVVATSWRSDIVGRGGFVDCPTDEELISVAFIKDVIVCKFERSSWKIIYTGNQTFPFYFEKVNAELGAESTFSMVQFDRGVFSIGNVGICVDDSVNVSRIDEQIPNLVFDIRNNANGPERVHGIRDYTAELVYWTYPTPDSPKFPNRVLLYNYRNQSYAIFHDSFTCYGYYQADDSITWGSQSKPNNTWGATFFTWASGALQDRFPNIVAGNQQGYVCILDQTVTNDISLTIRAITPNAVNPVIITSPNHNLVTNDFVMLFAITGTGTVPPVPNPTNPSVLNNLIYRVVKVDDNNFTLQLYNTITNVFDNVILPPGGSYIGFGQIIYVNNLTITSKIFTPFYEAGGQARIPYIDFLLMKTTNGETTCNVYIDEVSTNQTISDPATNSGLLGTGTLLTRPENTTLIPYQQIQDKIWHRFFIQAIAQNFQVEITLSDAQMSSLTNYGSNVVLHAIALYVSKNARLTQ